MTPRRTLFATLIVATAVGVGWLLFVGLPRWYGRPVTTAVSSPPADNTAEDVRTIKARLFYVAPDGTRLDGVEREVPFAEQTVAQARHIVEAQLKPVEAPLVSAIPAGTTLRAVFVTPDGSAYVDLSADVATAHPGGSINELLTIYTIVQALTVNLPAVTAVQVLVDGREMDTLAGHVDIKRPLPRADVWVAEAEAAAVAPGTPADVTAVPAVPPAAPSR
ncbi:MAG: GerMN domain-containing protein [Vicinamibacterales bacterium]